MRAAPVSLIGLWTVQAAGEDPGTMLRLGPPNGEGFGLFRSCGVISGSWAADASGLFAAGAYGSSGECAGANTTPVAESEAQPPVVTEEVRRSMAPSAPLPPDLDAPDPAALLGRWVPLGHARPGEVHVEFAAEGAWTGSDRCNGLGGRWRLGAGGAVLATGGPTTLIGCQNIPVQERLVDAARAGMDGDVRVLLDRRERVLGRFRSDTAR